MVSLRKKYITNYQNKQEIKEDLQLLFLQRLHRLLSSGYPLIKALEVLEWHKELMTPTEIIREELMKGKYMDEAFQHARFHHTVTAYLYFVRFNNDLTSSLEKAMQMFEQRVENRKKFTRLLRYPLVLSFMFIILLFFLKRNILPSFVELFQYSNDSSSTVLYSIIFIDIATTISLIGLFITLVGFIGWKYYRQKLPIEDQLLLYQKIPIYRFYVRMQTSYYFATHISMFLQTGMSMNKILDQMSKQKKLPIIAYYTQLMQLQLQNGFQLGPLLMNFPFIEQQIAYIFDHNQNNDTLEQDLRTYADYITENMEGKTTKIIMLIQPIFFIILAIFIIFVYMTLMWPMFQLIQSV